MKRLEPCANGIAVCDPAPKLALAGKLFKSLGGDVDQMLMVAGNLSYMFRNSSMMLNTRP